MFKPILGICPEGWPFIGLAAFSAFLCALLDWCWPAAAFWILCIFAMWFFRDPQRVIAEGAGIAVSPADGTIIAIEKRNDPFSGEEVECISIFMSVFNVHVNRSPVDSAVREVRYIPGKFFNASLDKASKDNERCLWLLEESDGTPWTAVQIAGLIARRIVPYAAQGDHLARGQRLGMIRFGSRVDVYVPKSYAPAVVYGAKVYGGQTVLARKKEMEMLNG